MNHDKPVLSVEIHRGYWNRGARDHAALLGIDMRTISALASAADDVDTPKGRRLVRALSTPNNTLREECRAVYGDRGL